jgi:biotin--protein ligase
MNVLVYAGPEVPQTSLTSTLSTLRSVLVPYYSIQKVSLASLGSHPWTASCALLVLPAGSNLSLASAVTAVSTYVENGGAFLAFGAGAKYSPRSVRVAQFLGSTSSSVDRVLQFFDNGTASYIHPTFHSGSNGRPRSVSIRRTSGETLENIHDSGANSFVGLEDAKNIKILARYLEGDEEGKVAAVKCVFGKGGAILLCPNLESPITQVSAPSLTPEIIALAEQKRQKFVQDTLADLGLHPPSFEERRISRPLPQFLVSYEARLAAVSQILEALAAPSPASQLSVFEDSHDVFHFHPLEQSSLILQEARSTSNRVSCEASVREPKHIVVCPDGQLPDAQQTPLFDLALYFDTLYTARKKDGCARRDDSLGFGEAVLYGEVVTSTQTMLDK